MTDILKNKDVVKYEEMVFFIKQSEVFYEFSLNMNVLGIRISLFNDKLDDINALIKFISSKRDFALDQIFNEKTFEFLSKLKFLKVKNTLKNVENTFFEIDTFLIKKLLSEISKLSVYVEEIDSIFDEILDKVGNLEVNENQDLIFIKNESFIFVKNIADLMRKKFNYFLYIMGSMNINLDDAISRVTELRNMTLTKQSDLDEIEQYLKLKERLSKIENELGNLKLQCDGIKEYTELYLNEMNKISKNFVEKMTPIYQKYQLEFLLEL